MVSKRWFWAAVIVTAGILVLAGCGAGGGGGGEGGGDEGTGAPSVTGYHYVLTKVTESEAIEETEIIRGTAATDWIATNRQTGDQSWGTYTVLTSGIIKLELTGYTNLETAAPPVFYAVEIPNGYLFVLDPFEGTASGGYTEMGVAQNQEGACAVITTQGAYNLVKTGQDEWDQSMDPAFGIAAFSTGETGVDLDAFVFGLGTNLSGEWMYGVPVTGMGCTAGMGGTLDDKFAFTATTMGVYTHSDGFKDHDFVVLPEPASAVDAAALMAAGKRYVGIWQGWEDVLGVPTLVTYLAKGDGEDSDILVDSFVDPDTGEVSGMPGTAMLARAGTASDRNGLFDLSELNFNGSFASIASVHPVGGKHVIVAAGQFDHNGDEDVTDPEDWFFMVLVEQ